MKEAGKPMDLDGVIANVGGRTDLAAQVYAASLLTIEVDTAAEQQYLEGLANGLGLPPESVAYMHSTLGVQPA